MRKKIKMLASMIKHSNYLRHAGRHSTNLYRWILNTNHFLLRTCWTFSPKTQCGTTRSSLVARQWMRSICLGKQSNYSREKSKKEKTKRNSNACLVSGPRDSFGASEIEAVTKTKETSNSMVPASGIMNSKSSESIRFFGF